MALDSYRRRNIEGIKPTETKKDDRENVSKLRPLIDSLPFESDDEIEQISHKSDDLDIEAIKRRLAKIEVITPKKTTPSPKNEDADIDVLFGGEKKPEPKKLPTEEIVKNNEELSNGIKNQLEELNKQKEEQDVKSEPIEESQPVEVKPEPIEEPKVNQMDKFEELANYQYALMGKYGNAWFTKVTKEERERYVELYSSAHEVSREFVEKYIDDSIKLWNYNHPPVEEPEAVEAKPEIVDENLENQMDKLEELSKYQYALIGKYGRGWFTRVTPDEREKFVELYSSAHRVSRESVEKNIDDSIELWNSKHPTVRVIKNEPQPVVNTEVEVKPKIVDEQMNKLEELTKYQYSLMEKYGRMWFLMVTKEERDRYVELYSSAHGVSKESVEKDIEDSIKLWNRKNPSVAKEEPKVEEKPEYKWEQKEVFKFEAKKALDTLKEVSVMVETATPEQKERFTIYYSNLSRIWNSTPNNAEEEHKLMSDLFDARDAINGLKNELSTMGFGSQGGGMNM